MKHHPKVLPLIAVLATLGLLFSPLIEIHAEGEHTRDMTIYGLTIIGDTEKLQGLNLAQNIQLLGLGVLLVSLIASVFARQRARLTALAISVFIISMIPAWMMVYVEDIIKDQVAGTLSHHYTYGMLFAMVALFCITFSIVNLRISQQVAVSRQQILDDNWE